MSTSERIAGESGGRMKAEVRVFSEMNMYVQAGPHCSSFLHLSTVPEHGGILDKHSTVHTHTSV